MTDRRPDLSALQEKLETLLLAYPAGNFCDVCARAVGMELREAGFNVEIVTIQNEVNPAQPNVRPPYIQAKSIDGKPFLLGQNGFHQANRIVVENVFSILIRWFICITVLKQSVRRFISTFSCMLMEWKSPM